jgi:hypothetical protein
LLNNSSHNSPISHFMNSDYWFLSFVHACRQTDRSNDPHRHSTGLLTCPKDEQISRKPDNTDYSMCLTLEREGRDRFSSWKCIRNNKFHEHYASRMKKSTCSDMLNALFSHIFFPIS